MNLVALLLVLAAAEPQDTSAYPELSAEALAPAIVQDLKRTLPDAYSMRDLTIFPPHRLKLKDGRPISWSVQIGLNAKGENGGYTGFSTYVLGFKNGAVTLHAFSSMLPGKDGIAGLVNDRTIRKVGACTPIPDARVQELLTAPISSGR